MSAFQRIAPAVPQIDGQGDRRPKRKRENTRQACKNCRQSKSKCDGERPACTPCLDRGRACEYEYTTDGVPRQSAMRARLETLEQLFKSLKDPRQDKAERLFERLRTNADVEQLLEHLDQESGHDEELVPASSSTQRTHNLTVMLPTPQSSENSSREASRSIPPKRQKLYVHPADEVMSLGFQVDMPTEAATEAAVDHFFKCAGTLLHVFTKDQAQRFQQEVYSKSEWTPQKRAAACSLFSIAAIGKAYDQDPNGNERSQRYYTISKRLFEDLIECRTLDALKVCTMLALYNIFHKATLALVHIEVGMSLAKYYGLEQNRKTSKMPHDQWIDYRKSWRTLLFFKSWLCFTLGYMAGDDILAGDGVKLEDLEIAHDGALDDMIQTETAKISLLKAKILRLDLAFSSVSAGTVRSIGHDLSTWFESLPEEIRVNALIHKGTSELQPEYRRSIYYIHLLYQGARMLLYRRVLSQHAKQSEQQDLLHQSVLHNETLLQALVDGRRVANMTASTLKSLKDENGIFKRCWLVIFQSFTAGTLILYEAAQKQLHGYPEQSWREDLDMAQWPLSTLEFCATIDPVAKQFYEQLQPLHRDMGAVIIDHRAHDNVSALHVDKGHISPLSAQYLCQIPKDGGDFTRRSLRLRQLLCRPFGEPNGDQNLRSIENDQLDWHLGAAAATSFHWTESDIISNDKHTEAVDIRGQTNFFLAGDPQPSGWAPVPEGSRINDAD